MEQTNHIYLVELVGEGWSETYFCASKEKVEQTILTHTDPTNRVMPKVTVHEGYFQLEHSTPAEIKVFW